MKNILIVVDMQNDFIDGSLGTKEAVAIIPNVEKKIKEYINNKDDIIFTRDTHHEYYFDTNEGRALPIEHCIYGTKGWQIPDNLDIKDAPHLNKFTFGFSLWDHQHIISDAYVEGEDVNIEIVGLCTDICVVSNALILKAVYPEANISVDANCCAGTTPEAHLAALQVMRSCQIEVKE